MRVDGHPAQQGSKRHVGRGVMVEMDKKLPAWRAAIRAAVVAAGFHELGLDFPLHVQATWYLPAPARSKFGDLPAGPPDLDKLQRALGDGLTLAGMIHDDARITRWSPAKRWALDDPYALVTIREDTP